MSKPEVNPRHHFVQMTEALMSEVLVIENNSYPVGWSLQHFKDCFRDQYITQVLKLDDTIIGYYVVQQILDEFHLLNLCVAPDFTGRGFGKYQLAVIVDKARSENINRILLEVRANSKIARKLYRNAGFEIIGKRKNYYPTSTAQTTAREDAFVMELPLS